MTKASIPAAWALTRRYRICPGSVSYTHLDVYKRQIEHCILPEHYRSLLNQKETQMAIKLVKDTFERKLADNLRLIRVSAPLFVEAASGLNDNLNGVERPVHFDVKETQTEAEIVHSLAKWKRLALKQYDFGPGEGLYTDMNAIRRDEDLDSLHSI